MSTPIASGPKPAAPAPATAVNRPFSARNFNDDSDSDGQATGGRRARNQLMVPLPTSTGLAAPAGRLLKGAVNEDGKQKDPALLLGIKLDLEAEVHLTARVKGDICVGLY